ncbi:MAG TPA: hypothetical protein VN661_00255 [Candidatus Acidoferrales bacterium]|nr:hypothetical protein [Candidatus Acidoferrales bacterium]
MIALEGATVAGLVGAAALIALSLPASFAGIAAAADELDNTSADFGSCPVVSFTGAAAGVFGACEDGFGSVGLRHMESSQKSLETLRRAAAS